MCVGYRYVILPSRVFLILAKQDNVQFSETPFLAKLPCFWGVSGPHNKNHLFLSDACQGGILNEPSLPPSPPPPNKLCHVKFQA